MALPFTTGFAGPSSVYVTGTGFQGKMTSELVISYARDPKKFAVNKLVTRTPTNYLSGVYPFLRPEALARDSASLWVDGQERPRGSHNEQDFNMVNFQCNRVCKTAPLGWQTREQAIWPIETTQLAALGHQMMTRRSIAFYNTVMNPANLLATNVKTATAWSNIGGTGGFWSAGTSTNRIIDRTLKQMANAIRLATLDAVSYLELALVITPPMAIAMSTNAEIADYLARSQFALAQIKGDAPNQNYQWGLPEKLYGMTLLIDGTLKTTSPRLAVPGTFVDVAGTEIAGADSNADNTALVMAMPGDLKDNVGQVTSSFSSVHMFVYRGEEMITETISEQIHKRDLLSVSETYGMSVVSRETVSLSTNCFS